MRNASLFFLLAIGCTTLSFGRKPAVITNSSAWSLQSKYVSHIEDDPKIDSASVHAFFSSYPKLKNYESEVLAVYRQRNFRPVWFNDHKIIELGTALHRSLGSLSDEGLQIKIPYKEDWDQCVLKVQAVVAPTTETELLFTAMYFFYTQHVFQGLDDKRVSDLGWHIPRKKVSYVTYLDTLIQKPGLLNRDDSKMFKQYYLLRDALKKYRSIAADGKWDPIAMTGAKPMAVGESSATVSQIRERLFRLGYLSTNNRSSKYDKELAQAVLRYKKNTGITVNDSITGRLIASLNVPMADRIKTIIFNMERCRWIPGNFNLADEYIFINIPSYQMNYYKAGKTLLNSKVVVGKVMNQTVVFSGMLQYIVFSPYWNVPKSIMKNEILPALRKNKRYLAQHNMEWNGGNIRQKPGPKNSLGLVKFLFPNSNSIYLHDTPSKNLFQEEKRAFSHGCIRLEKPVELAYLLLKDDKDWPLERLNNAFHSKKEIWYTLKNKIPVYIGYFTAWVERGDEVQFYEDVYARDECLTTCLFDE